MGLQSGMIEFKVDQTQLQRIELKLKDMKAKAPQALKNAVNATARDAKKDLADKAKETYAVKSPMSDTIQSVKDLPEVSFIDNDTLEAMKTRMVANFESEWKRITGQEITLSPSDPNRIMLYAIALELYQDEQYIDRAGKQDLIKYSYGEFLDNLGAGRGVTRKQPSPAETTLRFTLSEKRPAAVGIPEGTKVTDGNLNYFATVGYEEIPAGETYVDVRALCTENGVDGNELLPGQVNVLVDLIPYVESVSNTTKTSGGADLESDESLAERIFLAPSGYSVAGPDDAYKYWTKTYSQTIGDVKVTSPNPVEVEIRFIMTDGELPTKTVIDGVAAYLQDENIRPLTDKVTVLAPETVKFNIAFTYYVNLSDQSKAGTIQAEVAQAVADYIEWQTRTIGRDINPSELMKRIVAAGAKRAEITSPVFTTVPDTSVARIGTQTVTYGGVEND